MVFTLRQDRRVSKGKYEKWCYQSNVNATGLLKLAVDRDGLQDLFNPSALVCIVHAVLSPLLHHS